MAGGGGSWKVAYADFTTAMMAFFMCMWILNIADPKQLDGISNFFRPKEAKRLLPAYDGLLPNPSLQASKLTSNSDQGDGPKHVEMIRAKRVKKELLELLEKDPTIKTHREAFELKVTSEGLIISIFNKPSDPIFEIGSDRLTKEGKWLMGNLSYTFDRLPKSEFEIQGHTKANEETADPWKLSVDRAIEVRTFFIDQSVPTEQITRVSGFGDTQPLENQAANGELNDRVDILLRVNP